MAPSFPCKRTERLVVARGAGRPLGSCPLSGWTGAHRHHRGGHGQSARRRDDPAGRCPRGCLDAGVTSPTPRGGRALRRARSTPATPRFHPSLGHLWLDIRLRRLLHRAGSHGLLSRLRPGPRRGVFVALGRDRVFAAQARGGRIPRRHHPAAASRPQPGNAGYLLLNLVDWFGWLAATALAGQVVAEALRSRSTVSAEAS
jgi:hypothetical protein